MRASGPTYPSIELVLPNSVNHGSSRLPTYRASHLTRYHPYPRFRRSLDRLMQTVDYRDVEEPGGYSPAHATGETSTELTDADVVNLELALHADTAGATKGRRTLSTLVIDLALAFRRRCQNYAQSLLSLRETLTVDITLFFFDRVWLL
ncbi:hypothetical protein CERSUDRAFT_93783 [Gelatoporia subvermispora B]|uniref:Uncharacterized protein n=1 Tax=Ceriporiopsis subvermispora (strain B) TaxID=914234 RepID=M2RHF3_CERS8|nr:hypothetical protein CERSUDRAFT_93783 [Gelatoporia subvermispora B]